MTDPDLRKAFIERAPILKALGDAVVSRVSSNLQEMIAPHDLGYFLKIPPIPRIKAVDGFIEKAFRPGKNYTNPLEDITDQVGCRFVVLREDHTKIVNQAIQNLDGWDLSKDRDIQAQRLADPHHFDYLSDHWVIRPTVTFEFGGVNIPANTPCEIQVRTLLQHAYAEIAHSATYKPSYKAGPSVRRAIGKGAALVETTDSVFVEVGKMIDQANAEIDSLIQGAGNWHARNVQNAPKLDPFSPLAFRLLDAYSFAFKGETWATVEAQLSSKPWLAGHISENLDLPLYSQPLILLVFFLVEKLGQQMPENWILPKDDLAPIFAALSISPGDSLVG